MHTAWLVTGFTAGVGSTVILKLVEAPVQPLADGVTVIVAVTVVTPIFRAVKAGILPVPLAARPIDGVLLLQL